MYSKSTSADLLGLLFKSKLKEYNFRDQLNMKPWYDQI